MGRAGPILDETAPGQPTQVPLPEAHLRVQLSFHGIHATDLTTIKLLFTTATVIVTVAGCPGKQAEGCAPDLIRELLPLQSTHNYSMCGG